MQLNEYKRFLKTLAHPKRLQIINLLRFGAKNVTQIYRALHFEQSTTSRHLNCMQQCGFVFVKVNAQERVYSINKKTIQPLMKLMDQHTHQYCRQLCECKVGK